MSKETDTGLNPRSCKDNDFPNWSKPIPVGSFSVDTDRFYESGHRNLRYFKYPSREQFPLDLNAGIETAKRKKGNPMDEGIDRLLQFIMDNYQNILRNLDKKSNMKYPQRNRNPLFPMEFVSWRGLLRLIMCTPFEYRQKWIIRVTHFKGTFYLCQQETEESKQDRLKETPMQRQMCSWGYKFEQYCLAKSPDEDPRTNVAVDECSEFSCVFGTRLENHNLLYGAEMDGIRSERPVHFERELPLETLEFLELKTCLKDMNDRQMHSYLCYKIRNWWCQAFLVGIENIIVGWRDNNGFIRDIEELRVKQLEKQAKNWSARKCAWFLVSFLDCVKSLMARVDCPYTVFEFKYDAANSLITYGIYEGSTEYSFLPDYYIEFIESLIKLPGSQT